MLICEFCNKEFLTKRSRGQHQVRCPSNPDRHGHNNRPVLWSEQYKIRAKNKIKKKPSNQYIKARDNGTEYIVSKETSDRLSAAGTNRKHTDEAKLKILKARIKYLDENPKTINFIKGVGRKESYPEKYFKEVLTANNVVFVQEYRVNTYQLDFAILDQKIDLEIDGSQHYRNKFIKDKDVIRNNYLISNGWKIIRINWSKFKKLSLVNQQEYIVNILKLLTSQEVTENLILL